EYDKFFNDAELIEERLEGLSALRSLKPFDGIHRRQHAKFLAKSVKVRRLEGSPAIIEVRFCSAFALDTRTILANLVSFQESNLNEVSGNRRSARIFEFGNEQHQIDPEDFAHHEEYFVARDRLRDKYMEMGVFAGNGYLNHAMHDLRLFDLKEANLGRLIFPLLYTNLLYGALGGYLFGLLVGSVLHSSSKSKREADAVANSH
ncbi:hypothetical protein OAG68_00320, partial [bacterium]|nr:hypothetical protein [bacterium]